MPYTQKTGRYYKVVNGKRQYDPRYDKPMGGRSVAPRRKQRATRVVKAATIVPRAAVTPARSETPQASLGRQILETGGAALGGLFGPAGSAVGRLAGSGLASIVGLGDYQIQENVFLHGQLPKIVNDTPSGGTIIRHCEYIGDVITSANAGAFSLQAFNINPADEGTFPWLAQIAANYEEFQFEGLVFQFRSTSADALNSVNTALGTVIMATNYDVADPAFVSKAEMLNYEYSSSCKPSDSMLHMIECAPKQTVLSRQYTRPRAVPAGTDPRLYDLGKFQIATTGFQGTSVNVGELHATYQVRLLKPKLFAALGQDINYARHTAFSVSAAAPLGSPDVVVSDDIGLTFTSTTITFPVSRIVETYWVYYFMAGTIGAVLVQPIVTIANCTTIGTDSFQSPPNGTTTTATSQYFKITTLGNGTAPVLTFGVAGTLPTGTTQRTVIVDQSPNDLV